MSGFSGGLYYHADIKFKHKLVATDSEKATMMSCGRFVKNGGMKSFQIFKGRLGTLAMKKNTSKPFQYSHLYSVHSVKSN